jgi:hypothetical protein
MRRTRPSIASAAESFGMTNWYQYPVIGSTPNRRMHSWIRFILVAALMAFPSVALAALEPGLRLRVYDIGEEMDRLFALKPDQTPNYEKVPALDRPEGAGHLRRTHEELPNRGHSHPPRHQTGRLRVPPHVRRRWKALRR